jgi:predicted ester cyclase
MLDPLEKFTNFVASSLIPTSSLRTPGGPVDNDLEANKDVIRSFVTAWNERDFDRFDSVMAAGATLTVSGMTVPCDPQGTRAIAEEWTAAFPDWRFELRALVAEDDVVVAHVPYRGTFTRPIFGMDPTGRHAEVDEMVIFRVAGSKVVEAWEVYDEAGMWRQLGIAPPAA